MSSTVGSRVTIKDVAERAGVGLRTAKKVMSGREYVPEVTRARILAAAEDLGYRKNMIASALAQARTERIGIVYSPVTKGYFPEVERGFRSFLNSHRDYGFEVAFATSSDSSVRAQAETLEGILADASITGVVMQPVSVDGVDEQIGRLEAAGKPVITFGSDAPDSKRTAYIGPDAYKGGRIGAQILANYIGKQGPALVVSRVERHMQTVKRTHGFYDMLKDYYPDISPSELVIDDEEATYETIKAALNDRDFNGVFSTFADTATIGQVLQDLGRRDIVLVGFDMTPDTAELMKQGFIKVILEQNPERFSFQALKMMFDLKFHDVRPPAVVNTDVAILTSECLP